MSEPTTFQVTSWEEEEAGSFEEGTRITRVAVTRTYSGHIEGKGTVSYTMFYRKDGTTAFVGFERIEGSVGGKEGAFVLQHRGTREEGADRSEWFVVPATGSGELEGLKGSGSYEADEEGMGKVATVLSFDQSRPDP